MPFRSPKMYFCIFGFQRFVWWPKCTPASSSSFMVSAAMDPPSVGLRRAQKRRGRSHRKCAACEMELRRVLTVEPYVLFAQIAGPDPVFAAPQSQVDRELVLTASHDLADALHAHAFSEDAALDERLLAEGDPDLVLVDPRRGFAQRHHDPPPVGVGAVDGRLHQRRV